MLFYFQKNGREIGPLIVSEFRAKLKSGEIDADTRVRTDLEPRWISPAELLKSGVLEKAGQKQQAIREATRKERDAKLHAIAYSNLPLSSIPSEFGDSIERAKDYGEYLERQFPRNGPSGNCTLYRNTPGEVRAIFYFEGDFYQMQNITASVGYVLLAFVLGKFWHFFLKDSAAKPMKLGFWTAHDFCRSAERVMRRRWLASIAFWWLGAILMVGVLFAAIFALSMGVSAMDATDLPLEHENHVHLALTGLGILSGLLAAAYCLFRWAKSLRLPDALLTIEKRPYRLRKISWLELEETESAAL